ncbi:signal peptidase I [Jeotgalibacillus sp. ET6]|uniref:signal peptidase I n=1 Tax=Jeotgalibacillus sp. ET6 TaxID=3037260 RepID=UPI0024183E8A|nr:signal peptidase I [Jeotgalibacillus sp. ET6]MDG5470269.1 signal peptidase I [Jeotgalibacillus sp. ET6]
MNGKNEWWEWAKALLIAVAVAGVIRFFLFTPIVVEGLSMMPTLHDGNRMIVNKFSYSISQPSRFDVIVFHTTENSDYIKRVIGLPGDEIVYKNDQLYINEEPIDEPFLENYKRELNGEILTGDFTLEELTGEQKVPPGEIFVLGDNRRYSKDSRHIGTVEMDEVMGTTNIVFWPLNDMGMVNESEKN